MINESEANHITAKIIYEIIHSEETEIKNILLRNIGHIPINDVAMITERIKAFNNAVGEFFQPTLDIIKLVFGGKTMDQSDANALAKNMIIQQLEQMIDSEEFMDALIRRGVTSVDEMEMVVDEVKRIMGRIMNEQ